MIGISLLSQRGYAFDFRTFLEKYVGNEWVTQILGERNYQVPDLPEVREDATSTEKLLENPKSLTIDEEKRKKLDYQFVVEIYEAVRNQNPSRNEIARWTNVIHQGAEREAVYRALVLDSDYAGLENFENNANERAISFSVDYLENFLKITVSKEKFKNVNIYTLKRFLVEKTLNQMDAFLSKEEEMEKLFLWYAILSSQLAKDFKGMWKSNVRSNTSIEYHQKWASVAPIQFIKSEVILKLHRILNSTML